MQNLLGKLNSTFLLSFQSCDSCPFSAGNELVRFSVDRKRFDPTTTLRLVEDNPSGIKIVLLRCLS